MRGKNELGTTERVSEPYPLRRNGSDTPGQRCANPKNGISHNLCGSSCTKRLTAWVRHILGRDNDSDDSSSVGVRVVEASRNTCKEEPQSESVRNVEEN